MSDFGMAFGSQDLVNDPAYTTLNKRLQVDLNNKNRLFDVVPTSAGTNLSTPPGFFQSETLLQIDHNLGYVPQVFVTFTLLDKGTTTIERYAVDEVILQLGGPTSDLIVYKIDEESFTVLHTVDNTFGITTVTSTAGNYDLKTKYIICNNTQIHTINFE